MGHRILLQLVITTTTKMSMMLDLLLLLMLSTKVLVMLWWRVCCCWGPAGWQFIHILAFTAQRHPHPPLRGTNLLHLESYPYDYSKI